LKLQAKLPEPSISEVREELRSILTSARFRQSPRLGKLLLYICRSTLVNEAEPITEYTIALDVLGKGESFKEGKDAIVRVEVHRLRKRLAEFYENEGEAHRVRIVIPSGNYAPQFQVREDDPPDESETDANVLEHYGNGTPVPAVVPPESLSVETALSGPFWRRWPNPLWVVGMVLFLVALLPAYQILHTEEGPLDAFWNPVLASPNQVLLCIGNLAGGHTHPVAESTKGNAPFTLKDFHNAQNQMVHAADATTLARFAGLIASRGKRYRIVSQSEATYADLQNGPAVLIGLLNNDWTKRLIEKLRFTVDRPGGGRVLIRDRANPTRNDWFINYYSPYLEVTRDYALVLRATDPKTEQMTVMAAGMSIFGTLAAGEFLTNRSELRKLDAVAPKGWRGKNLEIVLSTEVIRGNPGPPAVVAAHFW